MVASNSTPNIKNGDENFVPNSESKIMKKSKSSKSLHKKLQAASLLNTVERPPSRHQIDELERYMLDQVDPFFFMHKLINILIHILIHT